MMDAPAMDIDLSKIDGIIASYPDKRFALMGVLQDVQREFNYLPREALKYISEKMEVPLSRVMGLVTFYAAMSLVPRGRHTIKVCLGTACHLRGGKSLAAALKNELGLKEGENTTQDMLFTLESVHCLGACALAPVVMVGDTYYPKLSDKKIKGLIDSYRKKKEE